MILFLARAYKDRNGAKTREEIVNLVRSQQGLTKTELTRRLGLAWGTVYHHLRVLYRARQLVAKKHFGWTRIYTVDAAGDEIRLMPLMRLSLVNDIVERVRQTPGIGIQALSKQLGGISRKVVRRHLMRLVDTKVLERTAHYRPRFYIRGTAPGSGQREILANSVLKH